MSDLDGTDIRDEDINEPIGSCDDCALNIYEESADTGLCDACEFAVQQTKIQRCQVCGCSTKLCEWSTGNVCAHQGQDCAPRHPKGERP